jgi:hypothetical protein
MKSIHVIAVLLALLFVAVTLAAPHPVLSASGEQIAYDAQEALQKLYKTSSGARAIGERKEGSIRITTPLRPRMVCKPGSRSTATHCSS